MNYNPRCDPISELAYAQIMKPIDRGRRTRLILSGGFVLCLLVYIGAISYEKSVQPQIPPAATNIVRPDRGTAEYDFNGRRWRATKARPGHDQPTTYQVIREKP